MKRILGLDLGTNSIGWAVVDQAENDGENSHVIKLGVRVNPLTTDEKDNFEKGKSITTTAEKTLKHSMRINLFRYKLRRQQLIRLLKANGFITSDDTLTENGTNSTFETYRLRAKAARQEVTLEELARVLLMINKKRGYKSNRKTDSQDDGQPIDGMEVARKLQAQGLTPGQYAYDLLKRRPQWKHVPEFYRSDLEAEFQKICSVQRKYYPDVLTDEFLSAVQGKGKRDTAAAFFKTYQVSAAVSTDRKTRLLVSYRWRDQAVRQRIELPQLAAVLVDVNGQIAQSSSYLGAIGDRSKELAINNMTIGEHIVEQLRRDPHFRVKNRTYYRQDYLHEFDVIWNTQSRFHPQLTPELRHQVRDLTIFYQRPLKSKKGLVAVCELEGKDFVAHQGNAEKHIMIGPKVCPKSSPLYQEFKIRQEINNVLIEDKAVKRHSRAKATLPFDPEHSREQPLTAQQREILYNELQVREQLSGTDILKLLGLSDKQFGVNMRTLHGNTTSLALMNAYKTVLEWSGHDTEGFDRMSAQKQLDMVRQVFTAIGAKTDFLTFHCDTPQDMQQSPHFKLWHLLYSYEGDNSATGSAKLIEHVSQLTGLTPELAAAVAAVTFAPDFGAVSSRAIFRLLPHLRQGCVYSDACARAGYNHSRQSITSEDNNSRTLASRLNILPKNSLRNPVVEKILNQMIHVVNGCMAAYGVSRSGDVPRFDEIHIELARSLRQNQAQRETAHKNNEARQAQRDRIAKLLVSEFHIDHPSRADILRYQLYEELAENGHKTLYTNTYIPRERLFSRDFDIEHIIPQSRLFDDSYANKTLETREANIEKSDRTALDYVRDKYGEAGLEQYKKRIAYLYDRNNRHGTNAKYKKLMTSGDEIPSDFLNRDLTDSQYIARKARELLMQVTRQVVPTTGAVTACLREDWGLVNVLKELNWDKYARLGLTECHRNRDGHEVRTITGWTKRNDHRHHAMDALTIAFTRREHINYLNHLNARDAHQGVAVAAHTLGLRLVTGGRFVPPIPLDQFRSQARQQLSAILVSIKAKNKVMTPATNQPKGSGKVQHTLTPRGQLHNETVYGAMRQYVTKEEKVGSAFDAQKIATVARKDYREALQARLEACGGDAKKAFTGRNALDKTPLWADADHCHPVPARVKTVTLVTRYTVRKPITRDLVISKVVDAGVRCLLTERLAQYQGPGVKDKEAIAKAFSNLDENPIWLNRQKGISIKSVKVFAVANAVPLHEKRDNQGQLMHNAQGQTLPADFVNTSNNHHVAIFADADGNWHEHVVSFFEATARVAQGQPPVDYRYNAHLGWKFLFTMKQNEYFVFPDSETGFVPAEVDLLDPANAALIAPHLYRVQKFSKKDYYFRHQYETTVDNVKALAGKTYLRINTFDKLKGAVKVRVDHLGAIVAVGEYK